MEIQAGISVANFESKVFLGSSSETVPSPAGFKIYINKNLSITRGLLAYAHELSNAINIDQIRALIYNAYTNPKNSTNRTIFADGLANIEALGVYKALIVAYETGNQGLITLPANVITAFENSQNNITTVADALLVIWNYIKSGLATDENGVSIYQGYLDYYDQL